MSEPGSVTRILFALQDGDPLALQAIWQRYYRRLLSVARDKLRTSASPIADEEDVAQCAFLSFYQGMQAGRFPQLNDRENLWKVLFVITARKAADQIQYERRKKRTGTMDDVQLLEQVIGNEPTPEFTAQVIEQFNRMLDALDDQQLCQIAVWKMEGYTNEEIAERLDCSRSTIVRKLATIRLIWEKAPTP